MKRKHGMDYGGVDDVKASRVALLTPPTPSIEPVPCFRRDGNGLRYT